ncbi:MAG: hypothetical protein ACJ8H8_33865 [Geminicoccaceae bacterium]
MRDGWTVLADNFAGPLLGACVATAEARRQLAAGGMIALDRLQARLAAVPVQVARGGDAPCADAALVALLDELGGLVGQLEAELEAARARLIAADRHRHAEQTYTAARRPA